MFQQHTTSPKTPVAGRRFTFTLPVIGRYSRQPLTTGTLAAKPSVDGRAIKHTKSFKNGVARVSLVVPQTAKGKLLRMGIRISGSGGTSRVYGFRVG
jgi:hypothetical protein